MISCRARLVTMDETWLYHYDPETKQQSMEWRHSGSPRPQKFRVQNFSRLDFFWIKTASSSLIIFQRAKLSTRSINHLCWCNWRTFWMKNAAGRSPKGSRSCTTMLRLTALATHKKLAYQGFQCLDHPPYSPDQPPSHYHLFPGLKKNWKVAILRPKRRSLLLRRPGWTPNFWLFLSGLQNLEQRAKTCIELRGQYVE